MRCWIVPVLVALLFLGCGLPKDSARTLDHVRGGTMRVGIVANDPWVVDSGARIAGVEAALAEALAATLGARIEWVRKPQFQLVRALRDRTVDLVIGGFDAEIPAAAEVATTRPYVKTPDGHSHVLLLPPGENEWLLDVERFLETRKPAVLAPLAVTQP